MRSVPGALIDDRSVLAGVGDKWMLWTGARWEPDEKLVHLTRTRTYLRARADKLVRAAAWGEIEDFDVDKAEVLAKQLRSAPMVANVVGLARSNEELVATVGQWDADPLLATDPKAKTRCLSALVGTLSRSRVPHRWPAATWPQFIADAQTFCRDWAETAFLSGWAAWELFGCHRRAPWGRIQGMGLVLLLRGHEIAALTPTEAVVRTRTGARQTYRRGPADPLLPVERCLVWELQDA